MPRTGKMLLVAYVQMYLREEIQAEAHVRNLPGFARFLPILALFHGQPLNVAGLARDAGVARTTVQNYLEVAEDTLLVFRLSAYEGKLRVRERRHPKVYWVDPGLPRAVRKSLGPPGFEERGHLLEGWVAGLLRAYRDYRGLFDDWFYWASISSRRREVDFLLQREGEIVAIEVKGANRFQTADLAGLRAVAQLPGLRKRILVYQGERVLETPDGIQAMPVGCFLDELAQGLF